MRLVVGRFYRIVIFAELDKINLRSQIKPGARIAITCGSRRFDNYPQIIRAIVRAVRSYGGEPFLIPAMGSHGGGTAVGQKSFLTGLGITEDYVGAKIESSLEVEKLGETKGGIPVYADKLAVNADGIIVVNRVKPHTEYDGVIGSGLHKMLAIGVGKWKGAMTVHAYAFRKGYEETIIEVGEYMIKNLPIICGVGIIENNYGNTARIEAMTADEIPAKERALNRSEKHDSSLAD